MNAYRSSLIILLFLFPPFFLLEAAWLSPMNLTQDKTIVGSQLAVDNNGDTAIVWIEKAGDTLIVKAIFQFSEHTFQPIQILSEPAFSITDLHAFLNDSKTLIVSWIQDGILKAVEKPPQGSWSLPPKDLTYLDIPQEDMNTEPFLNLVNSWNLAPFSPKVASDPFGNMAVIWIQNHQIYTTVYTSGVWQQPTCLSNWGIASFADIKLDDFFHVKAIWTYMNEESTYLQTSSLNLFLQPPKSIQGRQFVNHFLFTSELVNEIKWEGSPSADVTGYVLYRWDSPLANISTHEKHLFYDHGRQKNVIDYYFIRAIDKEGNQSDPIQITIP